MYISTGQPQVVVWGQKRTGLFLQVGHKNLFVDCGLGEQPSSCCMLIEDLAK